MIFFFGMGQMLLKRQGSSPSAHLHIQMWNVWTTQSTQAEPSTLSDIMTRRQKKSSDLYGNK